MLNAATRHKSLVSSRPLMPHRSFGAPRGQDLSVIRLRAVALFLGVSFRLPNIVKKRLLSQSLRPVLGCAMGWRMTK